VILGVLLLSALPVVELKNVDCAKAVITAEVTYCADKDFQRADAEMNAQWKKTLARMRERDAFIDKDRDNWPTSAKALLDAQQKWIKFRDAHCLTERLLVRGGSAEPSMEGACLAKLTRERTTELRYLATWPQ
jgi:uncharacterized protein YecT (DUF1311 family)